MNWPQDQISGAFGHGGSATMGQAPNGPGRGVYKGSFKVAGGLNWASSKRGVGQLTF